MVKAKLAEAKQQLDHERHEHVLLADAARKTKERLVAARAENKKDTARHADVAAARAAEDVRETMEGLGRERDAALECARRAEEANRVLRQQNSRWRSRASDAAALRRKNTELSALRAENTEARARELRAREAARSGARGRGDGAPRIRRGPLAEAG